MLYRNKINTYGRKSLSTLRLACLMLASIGYAFSAQGPGLGNISYSSAEVSTQISPLIDDTTGFLPPDYPATKHFGVNMMTMVNGYMIGVFAPDSGGGPGGWIALDASNPRNLQLVKQVYEPDAINSNRTGNGLRTADFREPHSIGISEGNLVAIQTGKGIEIWNWTDVNNPIQVSKLAISGVNFGDYNNVSWQLFWQAPYLYISRGNAGLTIVNTMDVANPFVVKTIPRSELGGFNVGPIFALGNELFISSMQGTAGFSIVDISDPINPSLTKTISSIPQLYYASCWDGTYAYFGSRASADPLHVYDTTQSPMTMVSNAMTGFVNLYCNLQDNKLFMGNQDDINWLDVTNQQSMVVEGTASLNAAGTDVDHGQVFAFGNMVWVGNDHGTGSGLIAHQAQIDSTPPVLNRSVPEHLSVNQPLTTRVGLSLSDSVLMSSVNSSTFRVLKLGTTTPMPGTYSVNLGFVHFSPDTPFEADQIYVVELEGIQDFSGNAMPLQSFRFSTGSTAGHNLMVSSNSPKQTNSAVSFSAQAQPIVAGSVSYAWDFGDGNSTSFSSNGSATHAYNQPGHYTVIATVKEQGITTTKSLAVTVHNPISTVSAAKTSTIVNDGAQVYVVNEDNSTVTAINAVEPFNKIWEVPVGRTPKTLAISPSGNIWVVSEGDSRITVLNSQGSVLDTIQLTRGSQPFGVSFLPDQSAALVSLQATGELLKLDPNTYAELGRLSLAPSIRPIAIESNSSYAWVARFISSQDKAEVFKVDLTSMSLSQVVSLNPDIDTVDGPDRARGIPNYLSDISIAPDGQSVWVASNKANVFRGAFVENDSNRRLTFETTIRAITSQIDIATGLEIQSEQMDIDNRAQPKAIAFSALGDYVYIALEGQNSIEIRDAYSKNRLSELPHTGLAPRGMSQVDSKLFVQNFMSRSVSVFDIAGIDNGNGLAETTPIASIETVANEALHPRVLAGKKIFYNAEDVRMTQDGYISCASCHTDEGSDNRVWDFTARGEGLRNTISLKGRRGVALGNVHWTANFDEIHDFENDMRNGFGGRGFIDDVLYTSVAAPLGSPKKGLSDDLDNLAFYVESLSEFPLSPFRNSDGSLTMKAQSGALLFNQYGCSSCHSGDFYTDQQRHDVGTIEASSGLGSGQSLVGLGFKTPTLIGVFESAPYFHNGQAATLDAVLQTVGEHNVSNSSDRSDIVAYLQQIEYEGPEIIVPEPPAANQYFYLSDLTEVSSTNGWGPIEKDKSNGENAANDGRELSIGGSRFDKGLGVHALSEVVYNISDKAYNQFHAVIGVDDEVGSLGSVVFEVYVDNILNYQSGVLTGSDAGQSIYIDIPTDASELKLIVNGTNDGVGSDHANWANAYLRLPGDNGAGSSVGLFEGELVGAINTTDANPNSSTTINLLNTESSIPVNTTRVFSGYIYDDDGHISFMENIDDHVRLWVNGVLVLSNDDWSVQTVTSDLLLSPGWHSFELRIGNGSGPGGPNGPLGFGYDPAGGSQWIHPEDNGMGNLFRTSTPTSYTYASDMNETSSSNGWGPIEKDTSNGESSANDGVKQSIGGVTYDKGLGVHANSSVIYQLPSGQFDQFQAFVGIDDEVGSNGSVTFEVWLDGSLAYSTSEIYGSENALEVIVPIASTVTQIELKALQGAGNGFDHANWSDAKFRHTQ